jgi:carbonic anhydrase
MKLKRADFLTGTAAAMSLAAPILARASTPSGTGASPQQLLEKLMAGNKRFVNNDFPSLSTVAEKREMLVSSQAPFAGILGCADSRVIPNLIFTQGLGDLFVARVAGNFPDDDSIASFEYAIEHLGTSVLMVLGHESCGAVTAVYQALKTNTPLPQHLLSLENEMGPGIAEVVKRRGSLDEAIEANVRAAVADLKASPPVIAERVKSGKLLVVGGFYHLSDGRVTLVD